MVQSMTVPLFQLSALVLNKPLVLLVFRTDSTSHPPLHHTAHNQLLSQLVKYLYCL